MAEQPNTAVVDGVRSYYDHTGRLMAAELPDVAWPAFDDLDAEQLRSWMLAYAATIEVAVRTTEALTSLGLQP